MPPLDRSRDYAEVWSAGGQFSYEQDGRLFGADGRERDVAAENPPLGAGASPASESAPAAADVEAPTPLDRLSIADLKTMVEIAGGEWKGRAAAIAFLGEGE